MNPTFVGIPDDLVIALAVLRLKRCRVNITCETRQQAMAIIYGLRPAPAKTKPLDIISVVERELGTCWRCGQPIQLGEPVHDFQNEHITCPLFEAALNALYKEER